MKLATTKLHLINQEFLPTGEICMTEIQIIDNGNYLLLKYGNSITFKTIERVIKKMGVLASESPQSFSRIHDVSTIKTNAFTYKDMLLILNWYPKNEHKVYNGRVAFVVNGPLQYGLLRIYGSLVSSRGLKVGIYYNLEEAINWINEIYIPTPQIL